MEPLFPGLSAMENLHPVFVHAPLALLPLALVAQALVFVPALGGRAGSLQRAALALLWLGTLGALAAAGSGLLAGETIELAGPAADAAEEIIELHEELMLWATGMAGSLSVLTVLLLWLRKEWSRGLQALVLAGLLATCVVLFIGADRGGQLVYEFGVGTRSPLGAPGK
jgi:uncharacterized membrane protein